MKQLLILSIVTLLLIPGIAIANTVRIETNLGNIVLELNAKAAPKTVKNFIQYANSGYYNNTIFHRVIKGFMIQGGGVTADMLSKPTNSPIMNEAYNGLKNNRGTIAMARTNNPHSATSQFFINVKDNSFLDFKSKSGRGWGYCVFGKVVKGMEVVDKIEHQPTTFKAGRKDVPVSPIVITKVVVVK